MAQYQRPAWTAESGSAQDSIPGRFNGVVPVTGSSLYLTGSYWGAAAVIVPSGTTGEISSSRGVIDAADISGLGVVEIGPTWINQSGGSPIYVLYRNHGVI